jgi:hypothetical protein
MIGVLSLRPLFLMSSGRLQKPTVLAADFGLGIAGEEFERVRSVDDGHVRGSEVAEEESARVIDEADVDERGGAVSDGELSIVRPLFSAYIVNKKQG